MSFKTKLLTLFVFSTLAINTSFALPEDRNQPVELEADQAKLNNQTGISEYTGNVIIVQGTAQLKADRVLLYTVNNEITRMEAFGEPAKYQQILQQGEQPTHIEGQKLDLKVSEDLAIVTGEGKVHRGSDVLTGEVITYSLKSGELQAGNSDQESSNSRVKMIFHPPSEDEKKNEQSEPVKEDASTARTNQHPTNQ